MVMMRMIMIMMNCFMVLHDNENLIALFPVTPFPEVLIILNTAMQYPRFNLYPQNGNVNLQSLYHAVLCNKENLWKIWNNLTSS